MCARGTRSRFQRAAGAASFAAIVAALIAPAVAAAATGGSGGEHAYNWAELGFATLNFAILIGVLVRYTRKPIRDFMYQRSRAIRAQIETAQQELAVAKAEVAELTARIQRMSQESAELLAASTEQAEAEGTRLCARAEETAERIRQEAQRVASVEVERARRVLREEAVTLATAMAAELLREQLSAADDARLVDEFIERAGATTH